MCLDSSSSKHVPGLDQQFKMENIRSEAAHFMDSRWHPTILYDRYLTKEVCCSCNRSVRYFCSKCVTPSKQLEGKVPFVTLPIKIKIIKHIQELNSKSTSIQAKLLAPDDIEIIEYSS